MMKILIFAVVQAMIKQKTVSCAGTEIEIRKTITFTEAYHVCDKAHHDDTAGSSGTVDVKGNCRLNLTGLVGTNKLSVFGASKSSSCDDSAKFSINSQPYCANASVAFTLIDISGDEVVIRAEKVQPFKIQYYHGRLLLILVWMAAWLVHFCPVKLAFPQLVDLTIVHFSSCAAGHMTTSLSISYN